MVRFFAIGQAEPQGSKRGFATKSGKVVLVEQGGQRHKNWRDTVAVAAYEVRPSELLEGPIRVVIEFLMKRPKSKPKAVWVDVRPDCDKLARSCLDSMTSVLFRDDAQVVDLRVTKRYVTDGEAPGAWITVSLMEM